MRRMDEYISREEHEEFARRMEDGHRRQGRRLEAIEAQDGQKWRQVVMPPTTTCHHTGRSTCGSGQRKLRKEMRNVHQNWNCNYSTNIHLPSDLQF